MKLIWSRFLLIGIFFGGGAAKAAETDLASILKAVQFTQYVKAPGYSEGPTWKDGELFFCSGALLRVAPDGNVDRHFAVSPAGTVLSGDGRLLICDNKYKALLQLSPDGNLGVLARSCDGKPLESLNDLTIDARGNIYWTDPHGSSSDNAIGKVYRLAPDGVVARVADGLAFPNGLDVDPDSRFLYLIESQSKKILRYAIDPNDGPLGKLELFYELGGSGGDGCAFDAAGNLWVADFHRPETERGRITVLDPSAQMLATLDVPAKVVSNLCFGGTNHDEIFCTTGDPPGVFHAKVGVKGFQGHPGKPGKVIEQIAVSPNDSASQVYPRRFGSPGGVGQIRGWYVWQKWDPKSRIAEVTKDPPGGETYKVRVLPWTTTYRYLAYGGPVDDLLPGERVNLFFNADENHARGYLVHFQDELGQMKGHGHVWEVASAKANRFSARVLAQDKPLDDKVWEFDIDPKCVAWRNGMSAPAAVQAGERVYLTWCWEGERRKVHLIADAASLTAIQSQQEKRIAEQVAREGIGGWVDGVEGTTVRFMAFATHWAQAGQLKPGQAVRLVNERTQQAGVAAKLVTSKNKGLYGSGVNDMVFELVTPEDTETLAKWAANEIIRLLPQ